MLEVGVVGGGLMGMATSYFLLRSGRCRVTLYDASLRRPVTGYSACASSVAGGLLHPLTPRLKPAWEATEALRKADELVREAERAAKTSLVTTDTVLRPAIDDDDAITLQAAAADRPEWLEWLEPAAFVEISGRADLDRGGVRYIGGRCVDPRGYLDALRVLNEQAGEFSVVEEAVDPRSLEHAETILCGGADAFRKFPELFPGGLTLTRGESLVYDGSTANGPALLRGSYLCPGANGLILGATHEHFAEADAAVDAPPKSPEALRAGGLREAADLLAAPGASPKGATAGVRLNGPRTHLGRLPFAFRHEEGLWVAGGLGARGFLRHAQLGEVVARAVVGDGDVPEAFSPRRGGVVE